MAQTKRPSMLFRFSRGEVIYMHTPIKYSQWLLPNVQIHSINDHSAHGTVVKITWLCACPISTVEVAG